MSSDWQLLLSESQARSVADSPGTSEGVPGGAGSSAQMIAQSSPTVRGIVFDDVVLVYVRAGPGVDVCGGKIGTNQARFCAAKCKEGSMSCQYASHAAKADIQFPAYYIHHPKGTTAFCVPVLVEPETGFSGVIRSTLEGKRSSEDWARIFPTLAIAATMDYGEQLDMIARGERVVLAGPTPMKRRATAFLMDDEEDADDRLEVGDAGTHAENDMDTVDMLLAAIMKDNLSVEDSVMHMKEYWNDLVELGTEQREELKGLETNVRSNMEEVDDKVVHVSAMVGKKPAGSVLPLTVWAAISSVSETVEIVQTRLGDVQESVLELEDKVQAEMLSMASVVHDTIQEAQQASGKEMENVKLVLTQMASSNGTSGVSRGTSSDVGNWRMEATRLAKSNAEMEVVLLRMVSDQRALVEQVKELKETRESAMQDAQRWVSAEIRSAMEMHVTAQERSDSARTDVYTLRVTVEELRRECTRLAERERSTNSRGDQLDGGSVEEMKVLIAELVDEVATLKLGTEELRSVIVTDTIVFGKHRFESEGSYSTFVLQHFPRNYYGYCVDFISMLELGAQHQNRTTEDGLKTMKTVTGAGFVNPYEGFIWASFGTYFPKLFGKENDDKDPCKKMGSMTDAKEWDPKSSRAGRKNTIENSLMSVRKVLDNQIGSNHRMSQTAKDFFHSLVSSTWSFWEAFVSWITKFENEMCSLTPGDNPEAHRTQIWNLICWMIHSMLIEMGSRRAAGSCATSIESEENKGETAAAILQGTMGAHQFMKELRDHEFGKHPIFASTMVEFLITTKAPYLAVEDLRNTVKRIDTTTRMLQGNRDRKGKDS